MVQILSQSKALLTSMGIDSNMVCSLGNFTKKSKQPQSGSAEEDDKKKVPGREKRGVRPHMFGKEKRKKCRTGRFRKKESIKKEGKETRKEKERNRTGLDYCRTLCYIVFFFTKPQRLRSDVAIAPKSSQQTNNLAARGTKTDATTPRQHLCSGAAAEVTR